MALVKRTVANGDDHDTSEKLAKRSAKRKPPGEMLAALAFIPKEVGTRRATDNRPRVPNPWPPTDITTLLACACAYKTVRAVIELIKLWVDERKARKIRIKNGNIEIEIQGGMSASAIKKRFDEFRRLTKELSEDDIKIVLPPGIDRTLPTGPDNERKRQRR
jgi:hypothetical protein